MTAPAARRVLVVRRGGLGDTLLATPLLRALRREHAGATLHVAGTREYCDVLAAYGVVDAARSAEDLWLWQPERAARELAAYDAVFADEPGAGRLLDLRAAAGTGAPFGLALARAAGLAPRWPDDGWLLPPRRSLGGGVTVAPGSGGREKCWPRERWLALAAGLAARGRDVEVVVGPAERERDDPRAWAWPGPVAFVEEPEPWRLARRLEAAHEFVGNDSGVTHLAAALGVPTVAVFVATAPHVWAPVGPHVRVVGDGSGAPEVAAVLAALGA